MRPITSLSCEAELKQAFDLIAADQAVMLETLVQWSTINSGSRNLIGLRKMEESVLAYAKPLGAEVVFEDLPVTESVRADGTVEKRENGRSIRLIKRPNAVRRVLLTGHTDTVFPADSAFQSAKLTESGTLHGPGVADMKGGILVMLRALAAFESLPGKETLGWEVLLSPDEETGSLASGPLLAARARTAHIGLTYEPALPDGTLAGQRKGSGNFSVVIKGVAAHAGRSFHDGRNAVVHAASLAQALASLTGMRPGLTVNVAAIEGGSAPNVVPDLAVLRFNIRLNDIEDLEPVEEAIEDIIEQYNAAQGFSAVLHGQINRPPKVISKEGDALMALVKACGTRLGLDIAYVATGGCCEGNNLAAAGLPNVDTLGVRGALIHSDQEYMIPESLSERASLSLLILAAFHEGYLDKALGLV